MHVHLRSWAFLLLLVEGQQGDVGDLDNLEAHTGNITDGMTLTTETGNQDLVVLLNVVQATVTGHEGGDLLAVLDELHPHALADGRVRLLGLDADLLQDDSLGVGSTSEGISLPSGAQMSLLVVLVGPTLVATVVHMLPGSAQTSWLACCRLNIYISYS